MTSYKVIAHWAGIPGTQFATPFTTEIRCCATEQEATDLAQHLTNALVPDAVMSYGVFSPSWPETKMMEH